MWNTSKPHRQFCDPRQRGRRRFHRHCRRAAGSRIIAHVLIRCDRSSGARYREEIAHIPVRRSGTRVRPNAIVNGIVNAIVNGIVNAIASAIARSATACWFADPPGREERRDRRPCSLTIFGEAASARSTSTESQGGCRARSECGKTR
jgi:hypothetical protein